MNKLFNRLTFPTKLAILGIFPLLFIFYLSLQLNKEANEKIDMVERFEEDVLLAANVSELVDALQVERRFTFGNIIAGGWDAELVAARNVTNEKLTRVEEQGGRRLRNVRAYSTLDKLQNMRTAVNAEKTSPGEIMGYYTGAILRLNNISQLSTDNVVYLSSVSPDMKGQRLLSQMITYLGIIRGNFYYATFSRQDVSLRRDEIMANLLYYHSLEKEFFDKASPEAVSAYRKVKASPSLRSTIQLVTDVAEGRTGQKQFDPEAWWNTSAGAVDELKEVQRDVLAKTQKKTADIVAQQSDARRNSLILLFALSAFIIFIIWQTIKNISGTLSELRDQSMALALGHSGMILRPGKKDVVGELAGAIKNIDENNLKLSKAAAQIGRGDFSVEVVPRSEADSLGNAIVVMKEDLKTFRTENNKKIWIQTGLGNIREEMMGAKAIEHLGNDVLDAVANYLGVQAGVFYSGDNKRLRFIAGYALGSGVLKNEIPFGSNLAGQVAESKREKYLSEVPENYFKISSGTGQSLPKHIALIPLVHDNETEGVLELASFQEFTEAQRELLSQAAPSVAIALQSAKSRARLQELLEETQSQAEELQTQHSELENLNSELEMQTQKLQSSEEELRVQQEELQETNAELEERSRLLEEKNTEIKKKAEELEQATRYKSEFLANISHELRTPLNSILLLSRLLHENPEKNLNEEQTEYAKVIQNSGNGLLSLIDEILDLSKIEAGKVELNLGEVTTKEIIADIEPMFRPLINEKKLDFVIKGFDNAFTLKTDKGRLGQIIKNLLSNAIKFTSQGKVELSFSRDEAGHQAYFSVSDSGIGIPQEKQKLVFEAFRQADGSTKRKYGGTGLGLSISRELARLLGGDITLTSEVGKGSTFTLHLPLKDAVPVNEPKQVLSSQNGNGNQADHRKQFISDVIPENIADDRLEISVGDKVVLIVEDDVNFAKALYDFTRKKGLKAIVTVRGDEAITLAKKYLPMAVLLDIKLPVKSGWEVMDELKSNPGTRHIPVHIMSSESVRNKSLLKGAIDFIEKPLAFEQIQQVFRKIEHALNKKDKKVLIIEDNPKHAKALGYFLETHNINTQLSDDITKGVDSLKNKAIDCVILDMGIPDVKTYETLEEVKKNNGFDNLPVIIFTGKSLSLPEEQKIRKYADTVIVKTAHSYQRMLDEVSIFLHLVEDQTNRNGSKQGRVGGMEDVLNGKVVLIADDDVRNIFSLSKALEKYNMKVITAVDGKDALVQLKDQPGIDLVLLDMMMPEMDGYEAAKKIRENPKWKDLPVIAVTAKAMMGDREKCIRAGASDYITKPVDIDQLLSLLRVWLYER